MSIKINVEELKESKEIKETDKLINKITLECLLNKSQYDKYLSSNIVNLATINKRDKKFYRKRILQLTKDILLNVQQESLPNDIIFAFEIGTLNSTEPIVPFEHLLVASVFELLNVNM